MMQMGRLLLVAALVLFLMNFTSCDPATLIELLGLGGAGMFAGGWVLKKIQSMQAK